MTGNYWQSYSTRRITRRRALALTAGGALGSAFLAACGGGDDDDDERSGGTSGEATGDTAGLLAQRVDTSAAAVPGGTYVTNGGSSSPLDPHGVGGGVADFSEMFSIYSTPLKWGKAVGALPTAASITGDAFEAWEISPDSTQITLTLRQNHKFDPRPPTNGRAMTVEDVKFSWDRSIETAGVMREILNEHGPVGPIESLETPDSSTVVIHLAFPYAPIAEMLSFWYFFIVPPEAVDQLQTDPRGSGPWQVVEHNPSGTGTVYRKNPDWYETGRPYLDEVRKLQIGEYAAAMAQFEAGEIWAMDPNAPILQEDILRLKRDHPELVLLQKPVAEQPMPIQIHWNFSQREDSPFKDQRLRQALAHLYDSEAFIAASFNTEQFADAGLPFTSVRETHLPTNSANWIDPRDPAFGPNAKYFEYDPDEAAKLIQASGFTGPFDMNFRGSPVFSGAAELLFGMFQAGGLDPRLVPLERNEWQQMRAGGYQGYSGMLQNALQAFNDDQAFVTKYTPYGVVPLSAEPIPEISDRVEQIRREPDPEARDSMIKQMTQDLAPLMFDLAPDINQPIYSMHQPWLKNYNVFGTVGFNDIDNCSARLMTEFWYDESERT